MLDQIEAYAESKDAASASVDTPLAVCDLLSFCQDIERLFRVNPMLVFKKWQRIDGQRYHFTGRNMSQEQPFDFDIVLTVSSLDYGFKIDYQQGIKTSTLIIVEPATANAKLPSKLTIIDHYDVESDPSRKLLLHTVDKSITVWAEHLRRYLYAWKRWSHSGLWRWYMGNIWQPMKPGGRRIVYILLWVALLEVVFLLLGMIIYYLEYSEV